MGSNDDTSYSFYSAPFVLQSSFIQIIVRKQISLRLNLSLWDMAASSQQKQLLLKVFF